MTEWLQNPLVSSIIGISGIIIGILVAVFFYFQSKVTAKPRYSINNEELININKINKENSISTKDIFLTQGNEIIEYLNKTTIIFSNKGRKTINKEDITPNCFIVKFDNNGMIKPKFIDVKVILKSRKTMDVLTDIGKDEKSVEFSFNYLDYKEFFIIEIIHTFEIMPQEILGDVKGVPKGLKNISMSKEKINNIIIDIASNSMPIDIIYSILKYYMK